MTFHASTSSLLLFISISWSTNIFLRTCCLFILIEYLSTKLFFSGETLSSSFTPLHPNLPITFNFHSYSVYHPEKLDLENITSYCYQYSKEETTFLIEHLDGGPRWSYVTHEFAKILTSLKRIGLQANITYQSLTPQSDLNTGINVTKYFFNACQFDENRSIENPVPRVILRLQWNNVLKILQIRCMVFIDDLHYIEKDSFVSRQYFFQFNTLEIFSTYACFSHKSKITWLPHVASSRAINQSAENLPFISGANTFAWYPCRSRAFPLCKSRKDLTACLKHLGCAEIICHSRKCMTTKKTFESRHVSNRF